MHSAIRQRLATRLLRRAGIDLPPERCTYKHCRRVAENLDCDANSVARLLALPRFKPTQSLKPELESRIAQFLDFDDYEALEYALMCEQVWDDFQTYCRQHNWRPAAL